MKILYYDCFSGISGDMNLGALIDVGVAPEYLLEELRKLHVGGYEIRFSEDQRKGITGTRVDVLLNDDRRHEHTHVHPDTAAKYPHNKPKFIFNTSASHHGGHHEHRTLHDIEHIIHGSGLSENVKKMSLDIFQLVAQAESKIHGKPVEEIHFHEVGAVDSIVDIVGAAICIDYLKPDRIISSSVEMGGGFVRCAHGTFPVPAPATLEIMKGKPMKLGAVPFETATPTGVAILAALADEFTDKTAFTIIRTGYGIGHRDTDIPNVLRVCICETEKTENEAETTDTLVMECNIDDMNPERYSYVMERLFESGADDVFLKTIMMKKSRPAVLLSVLCHPEKLSVIEHILFTETSTLGIRYSTMKKKMLSREVAIIETPWGNVRVKKAYYKGQVIKQKPEYEDCASIARNQQINIEKIYDYVDRKLKLLVL